MMIESKDFQDDFDKLGTGHPCDAQLECASLSLDTTQTHTVYVHVGWLIIACCLQLIATCRPHQEDVWFVAGLPDTWGTQAC